jgi:hypothetical protein
MSRSDPPSGGSLRDGQQVEVAESRLTPVRRRFISSRLGSVDGVTGESWALVIAAVVVIGVVTLVAAIWFARRLIVTRRLLGQLGFDDKVAFYGALAYMIFPVDLLPDPIYLDDIGVLAAALYYLNTSLRKRQGLGAPHRLRERG